MENHWYETFDELEEEKNHAAELFAATVLVLFSDAIANVEKHISTWFGRYGQMTTNDARRILTPTERKEFQALLKGYLTDDVDERWLKRLTRLTEKVRISRLDVIETKAQHEVEKIYRKYAKDFDIYIVDLFVDQYDHILFEMAKGIGETKVFDKSDAEKLLRLLGESWAVDGKTYSSRIWGDRTKLVNEIKNIIEQGLIRGDTAQKMSAELANRMNVSYHNAERLVKTESAFISSRAEKSAYQQFGIKQYEYLAIRDNRTSEICRFMHGKIFNVSDMKIGLNAPPLHCYCRSTTCPYFGEGFDTGDGWVVIDTGLTFDEWRKVFLK